MKVLENNIINKSQVKQGDLIKYIGRGTEYYWGVIIDNSDGAYIQNVNGYHHMYKGCANIEELNNKINNEKVFTFELYPTEEYAIRLEKIQ